MPRINIREIDNTTSNYYEQLYNVVYIPGFSVVDGASGNQIKAKTPTLFTTLSDFRSKVGANAAVFGADEPYIGFDADAVPSSNLLFEAGDKDPSYLYATELLKYGIPVVYERVNESNENTELATTTTAGTPGVKAFSMTAPTTSTAPTDDTLSKDVEYYVYIEVTQDATPICIPHLYLYTGKVESSYTWTPQDDLVSYYIDGLDKFDPTDPDYTKLKLVLCAISAKDMYQYLETRFEPDLDNPLFDRNSMNIKFLTTGGYPVFEYDSNSIVDAMIALASPADVVDDDHLVVGRGDCIVLVDHTPNRERPLTGEHSVFHAINTDATKNSTWATMVTPWIKYSSVPMPGSFAYLISMAKAVQSSPNWLAIAGVNRGVIPGATDLWTDYRMTRAIADSYMTPAIIDPEATNPTRYSIFINPIVNIRPYGLTIWGNRTLADTSGAKEKALYYLNMRSLITEVKKACYAAAEQLMFEQNSDILWINFKAKIVPLLDQMASSYGISGYKIIKQIPDHKAQLKALIKLFPIYAVEDFDITVMLTDEEVTVEESEE